MLMDFDHGCVPSPRVPFAKDFKLWKSRMSATEIADVKAAIHALLAEGEVHTTSWMPGSDWSIPRHFGPSIFGTPLQPIYDTSTT